MSRFQPTRSGHTAQIDTRTGLRNMSDLRNESGRPTGRRSRQRQLATVSNVASQRQAQSGRTADSAYWSTAGTRASNTSSSAPTGTPLPDNEGVDHGQMINTTALRQTTELRQTTGRQTTGRQTTGRPVRGFLQQSSTRLQGIVYDLQHWDSLPVHGTVRKLKYVLVRDGRPWALAAVLGVIAIIIAVALAIYFAFSNGQSKLKGGGSTQVSASLPPVHSSDPTAEFHAAASALGLDGGDSFGGGGGGGGGGGSTAAANAAFDYDAIDAAMQSGDFPLIEFD